MIEKVALASVSALAAAACFTLGMYVLRRNRHLSSSRVFFIVAMLAAMTALFDLLTLTSPNATVAEPFARGMVIVSTLLAASMLYLSSIMPFERQGSRVVRHRWGLSAAAVMLGAALASGGLEVAEDQFGWWLLSNTTALIWYALLVLFFLAGTIVLVQAHRRESSMQGRSRLLPLIAGMLIPTLSPVLVIPTAMNDQADPSLISMFVLASCLFVGYGVIHQKLFILEPVGEEVRSSSHTPGVEAGSSVLVETKADDLAYRIFVNEIASGGQGLLISRKHPEQLREQYGLISTPMLWLTTKPGADHIDPSSLSLLLHSVVGFLEKSSDAVILLDGLEYLEAYNKEEAIIRFFYGLRDAITVTGSKLIILVDPAALSQLFLTRLEREMRVIEP